jgi:hypothetical protein
MKRILFLYVILIASMQGYCQTIYYGYDEAGNRTSRGTIALKSTAGANDEENAGQEFSETSGAYIITIYPNPVQERLSVEIKGPSGEQDALIYLYSITGELITRIETREVLTPVSFAELARGPYILRIHCGSNVSEWKIIKE